MSPPERLSICIVTDAYLPSIGGVENHVLYLSAELKRLGHDVVVVTHKQPPVQNQVACQVESPVPVHRLAGGLLVSSVCLTRVGSTSSMARARARTLSTRLWQQRDGGESRQC
jgi:glycosyltransferase involved in cell wall biosynthesis